MGLFFNRKENVPEIRTEEIRTDTITTANAELLSACFGGRVNITADIAMQIPAVARCVDMIAGAVAMLPIRMYRRTDNGVEEIKDDHRLEILNGDTGDTLTADAMRYAWVKDYLLTGSAYAYIKRKYGIPVALYYVADKNVGVLKDSTDVIEKHYTYNVRGRTLHPYEMLKMLRHTDGFGKGRGIVQENPLIVDMAYNYLKFQRVQLLKGGNKKGFLKTEKAVTKGTLDSIKTAWSNLYSNSDTTERVMVLNDGIDFKEISNTAVEMQLSEMASATNNDIYKIFGTTDGILSNDTIKNAVMPVLDVMESAFDSDLLTENEKGLYYFAFDTRELTRGDINQRYSAYATALSQSFMQLDEVRALEDLPPLGVNFVKLGLNDVLLDPKTNRIYTPNTNAYADMGASDNSDEQLDNSENSGIIEDRSDDYATYDDKHRFTGSEKRVLKSASGGTVNIKECTEGYNIDSNGELYVPVDSEGAPYTMPNYFVKDYAKIMSEINNKYRKCYEGQYLCEHYSDKTYLFENHGFNEYNIYDVKDDYDD